MKGISQQGNTLVRYLNHETIWIQPWGQDSLRVRVTHEPAIQDLPGGLLDAPEITPQIGIGEHAFICNGKVRAEIAPDGRISYFNTVTGILMLEERPLLFHSPPNRWLKPLEGGLYHLEARFSANTGERFYGLGQHKHGFLDQKGCVIELVQRNSEVAIPFLLSNRGYGFLWNNPAIGRVELGKNETRWVAEASRQMDYWITVGDDPKEIMSHYVDAVGHAPMLPEFAAGFWQCRLRYRDQDEILSIAREYKRRGLPLSIIVIDYFHWTMQGDWMFDPKCWPDPGKMAQELGEMGVKVMVSIWPSVNPNSPNFNEMNDKGLLVGSDRGFPAHHSFEDNSPAGKILIQYYDATNPEARKYIWDKVRDGYYKYGIKVYWLDACEPEIYPMDVENLRFHLGNGNEVGCIYPMLHARAFYEGMQAEGDPDVINLARSAWVGSQRYGAAVWSGDIPSTFESLQVQVRAGLNIGLSGIPWWTTDIGGFMGGEIASPYFRELIVRWFQYGVFCPLFRLHGMRLPVLDRQYGSPNEVWSFGDQAYEIIKGLLFLREKLKPYILEQMRIAHEVGTPPMRPLFVDFPANETCWVVEDQFLFGPDLLVAPVLSQGQRTRKVYLPADCTWVEAWTGQEYAGGGWIELDASLERIPVFWRKGSPYAFKFGTTS